MDPKDYKILSLITHHYKLDTVNNYTQQPSITSNPTLPSSHRRHNIRVRDTRKSYMEGLDNFESWIFKKNR